MRGPFDKPHKTLTQAIFIFGSLFGKDERGQTVKTSKIVRWWGDPFNEFETQNTYYTVEFLPLAGKTIPAEYSDHPMYEES